MPIYKIPVYYEMYGFLDIEADSLEEAQDNASDPETPLPDNADYVDGSFSVDDNCDMLTEYNKDVLTEKDKKYLGSA